MDKETRHALGFLANAIINKGILPTADMNILNEMACGDFSGFEQKEQEEQIIDFDKNTYVKVKVRGRVFDCYLGTINQDSLNTWWQADKPVYNTDLHLIAVDPQPILM